LLAAALGLRREDEQSQQAMANGYRFAVRVTTAGHFLRDYHTAQVPSKAAAKGYPAYTRRDELTPSREDLGTILSSRDYRTDAYYQVAIEAREDARWPLTVLKQA